MEGTAAPKEKAVDGDVEGGFALNENPENGLDGVEIAPDGVVSFCSVSLEGAAPKLKPDPSPPEAFGSSFFGASGVLVLALDGPKLNGFAGLAGSDVALVVDAPNENGEDFFESSVLVLEPAPGGLPNVNGELELELDPPGVGVGTNPFPGAEEEEPVVGGLSEPKNPEVGAEGGLGIARPVDGADADAFDGALPD